MGDKEQDFIKMNTIGDDNQIINDDDNEQQLQQQDNDDDGDDLQKQIDIQSNQQSSLLKQTPSVSFKNKKSSLSRRNSSISKLGSKVKNLTTRLQVAQKLSNAKERQKDIDLIASCPVLSYNDSNERFNKKLIINNNPRAFFAEPFVEQSNSKPISNLMNRENIISGGDLVFDPHLTAETSLNSNVITRPYIYVTPDVNSCNIKDILINDWKLPIPRIALFLLSNPGELKSWSHSRQISAFKAGLMKAANTTSMWLFTNGLDVGLGKLIGDALTEEQKERQTFRSSEKPRKFTFIGITADYNLSYNQEFFGKIIVLDKSGPIPSQHQYELNASHTNFVILKTNQSSKASESAIQTLLINFIDVLTNRSESSPQILDEKNENMFFKRKKDFQSLTSKKATPSIASPSSSDQVDFEESQKSEETTNTIGQDNVSFVSYPGTLVENHEKAFQKEIFDRKENSNSRQQSAEDEIDGEGKQCCLMIPVVCLVIQGDYDCAKLVLDNIRRRNPVIVLRGSGGFADLLSYAYLEAQHRCQDLIHSWDAEFVEQTLKPLLVQKIVKQFPELRNNALARNTFRDRIIECVRESGSTHGRVYLSILNMHNSNCSLQNLPEFILLSLFKSQQRQNIIDSNLIRKDLYLTLDWNCPHVALEEVLRRNPSYNLQLEKSLFDLALLKTNREDFVDLFLTHGFRIHKYLTPFRLKRLLRFSLLESSFFKTVCMESVLGIAMWSVNFDELVEKLDLFDKELPADSDSIISNEFNRLIFTTTSMQNFVKVDDLYLNIMGMYPIDADSAERKSLAILTMWAVFNKRFKLAEILWKHSDQPIHLGLIISMILNRINLFVAEQNLRDELSSKANLFASFAIGVLDACYRQDEQRAYDLLSHESLDWERKTAVDIAANGSHRSFIAHPCCQKWLTNTFNGRVRIRELSWGIFTLSPPIKILLSAFFIFPMYIWIRFSNVNSKMVINSDRLLDRLEDARKIDEDDDFDPDFKTLDQIKLVDLNKKSISFQNSEPKQSNNLENAQHTITSIDDAFRQAWAKHRANLKQQQIENESKRSAVDLYKQRRTFFIRKQPPLFTMIYWLWNSPITKFWTFQVFYIAFLTLLSLAVIWPGCGNPHIDLAVCIWTFLKIIEYGKRNLVLYLRYTSVPMFFRIVEFLLLFLFLLIYGWGRVLINYVDKNFQVYHIDPYMMKVLLCLALLYFYYRLFAIHLPISPTLGPLLYRFKLMITQDFINFMRMALILVISSGIVIQAILYPNTEFGWEMFHKSFHRAIVSLFTTPVEELTMKCGNNSNLKSDFCPVVGEEMSESCPRIGFWSYFFTFQYFIFLKLVLMTLLYALFAATATRLQSETDNIWKFQRYTLVVDFASRPPLQAPLNLISIIFNFIRSLFLCCTSICRCCWRTSKVDKTDSKNFSIDDDIDDRRYLSKEDYNYWRYLAKIIYNDNQQKEDEKRLLAKQSDTIQLICEDMEHEKKILQTLKTKINEMERMIYHTQIYLENMKHSEMGHVSSFGTRATINTTGTTNQQRFTRSNNTVIDQMPLNVCIHQLSRYSPYVGTRIQRFPIADKFVSWDIIWINYDPVIYSRKKENFPKILKDSVDEDLLALKEQMNAIVQRHSVRTAIHLPVFNWNALHQNPAGLTIDRRSWIQQDMPIDMLDCCTMTVDDVKDKVIIYKLDDDMIPLNPFGRTGLKGKGNLPRWGPNHYFILIVSRSRTVIPGGATTIEFVMEHKKNSLFLPMRFIGGEEEFSTLQNLFACKPDEKWSTEKQMIEFFKRIDTEATQPQPEQPVMVCYMDSPENTDNAWKEIKLYHFHFDITKNLTITDGILASQSSNNNDDIDFNNATMNDKSTIWLNYYEDMLVRLPIEQVAFINAAFRRIQQTITL